jgi:OmpA-OmpF porin, OOP family
VKVDARSGTAGPSSGAHQSTQGKAAGPQKSRRQLRKEKRDRELAEEYGDLSIELPDVTGEWSTVDRTKVATFSSGESHHHGRFMAQGAIAFLLFLALLFGLGMTLIRGRVEKSLTESTYAALKAGGFPRAIVAYEGRDATVWVPAGADKTQVARLVRTAGAAVTSPHFAGPRTVVVVEDRKRLGAVEPVPTVAKATVVATITDGKLTLSGPVASESVRAKLTAAAAASFGGRANVTDQLIVANGGLATGKLETGFEQVLAEAARQQPSTFSVTAESAGPNDPAANLTLVGTVTSSDAQQRLLSAAAGASVVSQLSVREPSSAVIPEEGNVDIVGPSASDTVKQTQGALDELMATQTIEFKTGSSDLSDRGRSVVNAIARLLSQRQFAQVSIVGHTDNLGDPATNQTLSEQRAASVKAALLEQGVQASLLVSSGKGSTEPVADNGTADGRKANRRIAIILK